MDKKKLSVAIIGTRGIPNRYGGFESCAEELAVRLVERGHKVLVYCIESHPVKDNEWKGVQRVLKQDPEKYLGSFGQFLYDYHCNRHSRHEQFDIILHLGYTSDSVWYRFWNKNSVHIVNMDGQEWKRSKYSRPVRAFLRWAERLATRRSTWLVADSKPIAGYLEEKYNVPVRYIAYGANVPVEYDMETVTGLGLEPFGYDLVIARMEPENNIEMAIGAKIRSGNTQPLVIVGNNNNYKQKLIKKYKGEKVIRFTDAIYDTDKINSLRHYSRLYVHGHSVGGTNPSLLEAMACGCRIVAHRNRFNEAVLGEKAFFYSTTDELDSLFLDFEKDNFDPIIPSNLQKISQEYNWESVTVAYENLFLDALGVK